MISPYAQGTRWTLYRADALAVLPELADASVDGLVTDAPYSSGGGLSRRQDGQRG